MHNNKNSSAKNIIIKNKNNLLISLFKTANIIPSEYNLFKIHLHDYNQLIGLAEWKLEKSYKYYNNIDNTTNNTVNNKNIYNFPIKKRKITRKRRLYNEGAILQIKNIKDEVKKYKYYKIIKIIPCDFINIPNTTVNTILFQLHNKNLHTNNYILQMPYGGNIITSIKKYKLYENKIMTLIKTLADDNKLNILFICLVYYRLLNILFICGHSMGAILAQIFSLKIARELPNLLNKVRLIITSPPIAFKNDVDIEEFNRVLIGKYLAFNVSIKTDTKYIRDGFCYFSWTEKNIKQKIINFINYIYITLFDKLIIEHKLTKHINLIEVSFTEKDNKYIYNKLIDFYSLNNNISKTKTIKEIFDEWFIVHEYRNLIRPFIVKLFY